MCHEHPETRIDQSIIPPLKLDEGLLFVKIVVIFIKSCTLLVVVRKTNKLDGTFYSVPRPRYIPLSV